MNLGSTSEPLDFGCRSTAQPINATLNAAHEAHVFCRVEIEPNFNGCRVAIGRGAQQREANVLPVRNGRYHEQQHKGQL